MRLGLIWAQARGGVIGRDGVLPWHLPEDMAHFRALTHGATVVMGRTTWESLPARFRPLPGRRNIVLSRRSESLAPGAEVVGSLDDALATGPPPIWVIGGGQVYAAALPLADQVVVTEIDTEVVGDTLAPSLGPPWVLARAEPPDGWHTSSTGLPYRFRWYSRD